MSPLLVSICVPVFNVGKFLDRTLVSVLGQDYAPIEVIVADNASTDDTADVLSRFDDPRLKVVRNAGNIGPFPNWNRAVAEASGEFVAVYHGDDVYEPGIVSAEAAFLQANPEAVAVCARAWRIDEDDRVQGEMTLPEPLRGRPSLGFAELLLAMLEHGNFLVAPTFMARRDALAASGGFDAARFGTAADTGMWLRLAELGRIGLIDRPLMRYRVGENQSTWHIEKLRIAPADHFRVIDHFLARPQAAGIVPERLLGRHETARLVDEARCLGNLIARGMTGEALALSRRIWSAGSLRNHLRSARGIRYLCRRLAYALLLEAGLGRILSKRIPS